MAGRRLEYSKGTSAKFWSVNQVGSRLELTAKPTKTTQVTAKKALGSRVERALGRWADLSPRRLREELELGESVLDGYVVSGVPICALYGLEALARPTLWRGNRALAAGDPSGWNDVVDYCWAVTAAVDKVGVRSDLSARNVASVLLLRIALEGASKQVEALAGHLEERLQRHSADSDQLHLAHFAASMAEELSLGYAAARGPKGPLRELAKQALSKRLGTVLDRAADYQLDNTGLTQPEGIEFANFELMPVWWFALARLRRDNDLETPRPEHPLFATPFAKLPEDFHVTPKHTPWLARIEQLSKAAKKTRRKR